MQLIFDKVNFHSTSLVCSRLSITRDLNSASLVLSLISLACEICKFSASLIYRYKMEKFNKAQAKNLAAAQKLVDTYASSSEDEEELDEKHILGTFSLCYNNPI